MLGRALSLLREGVPAASLSSYARDGADAYDLVEHLRCGTTRAAAWSAYVCQTYADKLLRADQRGGVVPISTARYACALYERAGRWLERARAESADDVDFDLPSWDSPLRSRPQLVGMRDALYVLRTYVAYELRDAARPELADIDAHVEAVDGLWIARPTPELRAGIAAELTAGIRSACALGRSLALGG
jgi:hypothetical protein